MKKASSRPINPLGLAGEGIAVLRVSPSCRGRYQTPILANFMDILSREAKCSVSSTKMVRFQDKEIWKTKIEIINKQKKAGGGVC